MRGLTEHFVVRLGGAPWAIPLDRARECHPLPMLGAAPAGSPEDVVGIVDVRGERFPVVRPPGRARHTPLSLDDAIVVLETTRGPVAVLLEAVTGIRRLRHGRSFLLDAAPLPVLDPEPLWRALPGPPPGVAAWVPTAPQEKLIFASRARTLAAAPPRSTGGATAVVMVEVAGASFAVALDRVRAFIETDDAVPIPCTPPHVRGAAAVRGELVTVFDARRALGLDAEGPPAGNKAVVVATRDQAAGFLVDRIGDIRYVDRAELATLDLWDVDELLHSEALTVGEVPA